MPSAPKPHTVTEALREFARTLENIGIDPTMVEVALPLAQWRTLAARLDRERKAIAELDLANDPPDDIGKITVGGVRYLVRFK